MGCCSSRALEDGPFPDRQFSETATRVPRGGNRHFRRRGLKWTADSPMTIGQLQSQRDAFWDTAPTYEGRREVWQALRAAVDATDLKMSQSILDAAMITIPTGNLADGCYDELGNRYVVPPYCIVEPTNLIRDRDVMGNNAAGPASRESSSINTAMDIQELSRTRGHKQPQPSTFLPADANGSSTNDDPPPPFSHSPSQRTSASALILKPPLIPSPFSQQQEGDHPIVIRLSTNKDIKLMIFAGTETISTLRNRLYAHPNSGAIKEKHTIKFFYLGRLLEDNIKIIGDSVGVHDAVLAPATEKGTIKVPREGVIQVLVSEKVI